MIDKIVSYSHFIYSIDFHAIRNQISQFDSVFFLLFVILVLFAYYLSKRAKIILLVECIAFYMIFSVDFTLLILFLGFINYFFVKMLSKYRNRLLLILIISINVLILIYYRYLDFIYQNLLLINKHISIPFIKENIIIPLGISFFTFELIHYAFDVYKGKKPIKKIIDFVIFLFFFPTLIAGPIKRYENFVPQLKKLPIDWDLLLDGVMLIIKGFCKKVIFADFLGTFVPNGLVTDNTAGIYMVVAVYAFCLQIYFDFSGYTDIGRGCASLLGFRIPINFNNPYFSTSIRDFWRRWHITLLTWLRDYVYIPLGGSRKGKIIRYRNIFVVFLMSGLWHGAAWNFIIWGIYHGILFILQLVLQPARILKYFPGWLRKTITIFVTFQLVTIGWIFFKVTNLNQIIIVFKDIIVNYRESYVFDSTLLYLFVLLTVYLAVLIYLNVCRKYRTIYRFSKLFLYSFALVFLVISLSELSETTFIYFQF